MINFRCALQDINAINSLKDVIKATADDLISNSKKAGVKEIYDEIQKFNKASKSGGIDVDIETVAHLYQDVFSSEINQYSDYNTYDEIAKFKNKTTQLPKGVREALLGSGLKVVDKNGKEQLDWKRLMNMNEDQIIEAIKNSGVKDVNEVLNIVTNNISKINYIGYVKATKKLEGKKDISSVKKGALAQLAEITALNISEEQTNSYNQAVSRALGLSEVKTQAVQEINKLKQTLQILSESPYGLTSSVAKDIENEIKSIIDKTQNDASGKYAMVNTAAKVVDVSLLQILNNFYGIAQNISSGFGTLLSRQIYDALSGRKAVVNLFSNNTFNKIANSYFANISFRNQSDFGDSTNMFSGDISSAKALLKKLYKGDNKAIIGLYNTLMGVSFLNGIDSYVKVKGTWLRFMENAERVISEKKGISVKEARKILNKQIHGESWDNARSKAKSVLEEWQKRGVKINKIDENAINLLASDIVRYQLVENKYLSMDDLINSFSSAYRSAGEGMGHVANNPISKGLNSSRNEYLTNIKKELKAGNYTQAAQLVAFDTAWYKWIWKFAGGGTNWIVIATDFTPIGIFRGLNGQLVKGNKDLQNISKMTNSEIKETLLYNQNNKDRLTRGILGTMAQVIATAIMFGIDDEDKKQVLDYLEEYPDTAKMVLRVIPNLTSLYIAYLQDAKENEMPLDFSKDTVAEELNNMLNFYQPNKARQNIFNTLNMRSNTNLDMYVTAVKKINDEDEEKKNEGYELLGKLVGNMFSVNPLPTRAMPSLLKNAEVYNESVRKPFIDLVKERPILDGLLQGEGIFKKDKK